MSIKFTKSFDLKLNNFYHINLSLQNFLKLKHLFCVIKIIN